MTTLIEIYQKENQDLRDRKSKRLQDAVYETVGFLREQVTTLVSGTNDFVIIRSSESDGTTSLERTSLIGNYIKFSDPITYYKKESPFNYFVIDSTDQNDIYKVFALSEEFITILNALLSDGLTCAISGDGNKTYLLVKVKY